MTSWHDYPGAILGYTERRLLDWLRRNAKPGQTWLDIGAHYGYTAVALSDSVGLQGRVFAFEPVLMTAAHLTRTRALNRLPQLTVLPLALGPCPGLTALQAPLVRGMADHGAGDHRTSLDCILTVAFDEIWPSLARGDTQIHGVKIDVQGMEIDVLAGMQQTLSATRPLLALEIHRGVDRHSLLQRLEAMGYVGRGEAIDHSGKPDDIGYVDDCTYCFHPNSTG